MVAMPNGDGIHGDRHDEGEATRLDWERRYRASLRAERASGDDDLHDTAASCLGDVVAEVGGALLCLTIGGAAAIVRLVFDSHPVALAIGAIPVAAAVTAGLLFVIRAWGDRLPLPRAGFRRVLGIIAISSVVLVVYWLLACGCASP